MRVQVLESLSSPPLLFSPSLPLPFLAGVVLTPQGGLGQCRGPNCVLYNPGASPSTIMTAMVTSSRRSSGEELPGSVGRGSRAEKGHRGRRHRWGSVNRHPQLLVNPLMGQDNEGGAASY